MGAAEKTEKIDVQKIVQFPIKKKAKKKKVSRKKLNTDSAYKSNGVKKASAGQPIRNPEDYKKICEYLLSNGNKDLRVRNYALFIIGCDLGLRISDLLKLTTEDCFNKMGEPVDRIELLIDKKTHKRNNYAILTDASKKALLMWKDAYGIDSFKYIFFSRSTNVPIDQTQAWRIINNATKAVGLSGSFGTHSMRKTFGYQAIRAAAETGNGGAALELIQSKFNHESQKTTMLYTGIAEDEIRALAESAAKRLNGQI